MSPRGFVTLLPRYSVVSLRSEVLILCSFQLMKLMAVRRVQIAQTGKSDVPLPPAPPPHPGYAPNAALHAIKRHAVEFANPKELAVSARNSLFSIST